MLTHPTHERLIALGLTGMAKALEEQRNSLGMVPAIVRNAARDSSLQTESHRGVAL